jgi:DNA (cytosine-5)-methyltransferase 1
MRSLYYPGEMSRLVSNLRRLRQEGEETLLWTTAIEEMIDIVGDRVQSPDESHTWAALSHFFHAVKSGDDGLHHLRNIGVASRRDIMRGVCDRHQYKLRPSPHKPEWKRPTATFRFIDLFAGVGGFHLALASNGGRPVFVSEWDDAARLVYARNFGIVPYGDIRQFTQRDPKSARSRQEIRRMIPECEIVSAGFPCQPFSLAGVSSRNFHGQAHGLKCSTQGTLFEDVIQVAMASRTKAIVLENVKNLASHDAGRTLPIILSRLRENAFEIFPSAPSDERVPSNWAMFDSAEVSAQRRKRIYFVAVRSECVNGPLIIKPLKPLPSTPMTIGAVIQADKSMTETEKFHEFGISRKLWRSHKQRDRRHAERGNGFRVNLISDRSVKAPTLVARYFKDGKDCLITSRDDLNGERRPPRMLSPRECAILQTFPNDFLLPSSKTSAYRQMGNSVTVEVARGICMSLVRYLFRQ